MYLVLNPETGHVSTKFYVVFDDKISIVPFIREGKVPTNWINLVQRRSQSVVPEIIDPKDTWFNPDLDEYPIKTTTYVHIIEI